MSWNTIHNKGLVSIQNSLRQSLKLAFPGSNNAICFFTDASKEFWTGIVTQTKKDRLKQKVRKQKHELVAFLGGKSAGAIRNCTTYDKEAYGIVQTLEWMNYITLGAQRVHVFTDHLNLLYFFAPLAFHPNSPRHVPSKEHQWAIHLSRFDTRPH